MRKNSLLFLILLLFSFNSYSENMDIFLRDLQTKDVSEEEKNLIKNQPADRFVNYAKLQALNKTTGESVVLEVKVGDSVKFGDLEIEALKCWKSYPEERIENKLLLKVYEKKKKSFTKERIFYGWFFSSSPSVSSLEHPLYDIKLITCYNVEKNEEVVE